MRTNLKLSMGKRIQLNKFRGGGKKSNFSNYILRCAEVLEHIFSSLDPI